MTSKQANPTFGGGGGAGVVEYLMRSRLSCELTRHQAYDLWVECKRELSRHKLGETIVEAEGSRTGKLDTLPRDDVMDALARVLTGQDWPMNMTPGSESSVFVDKLRQALAFRGYARCEEPGARA